MGTVYLAQDNQLKRDVAIKMLRIDPDRNINPEEKKEIVARFEQEAQAAARLNHPNIITIYQVVKAKNDNYIVMEYLKGKPIENWMQEGRKFSIPEILKIGIQVCNALHYAHNEGVIHRDIKPANIFVDDDLNVKINDFGVARVETEALIKTTVGTFLGTPAFSSPEQWKEAASVDRRSDIYAFGVVLYYLLTNKFPFSATTIAELMTKILTASPIPMRQVNPYIPEQLDHIVLKSIAKDPNERYQNGREMARALESVSPAAKTPQFDETVMMPLDRTEMPDDDHQSDTDKGLDLSKLAESSTIIMKNIEFEKLIWLLSIFENWKKQVIQSGAVKDILDRILNVPIYTEPFSGALVIDDFFLMLIWKGHIIQGINLKTNSLGEKALETLPEKGSHYTLYTIDEDRNADMPLVLNTILEEKKVIYKDLDSSIIDIVALIQKLIAEKFTGAIHLRYKEGDIYLGFFSGSRMFILRSSGLDLDISSTVFANLTALVKRKPFQADVLKTQLTPLRDSIRRFFKGTSISVVRLPMVMLNKEGKIEKKKLEYDNPQDLEELKQSLHLDISLPEHREIRIGDKKISAEELLRNDFSFRFTEWFISDFFVTLMSSGNKLSLKYICTWIPKITTVKLNYPLKDEEGKEHVFDVVTMDENGKILHLVYRGLNGKPEPLKKFLETAISVKKVFISGGDIGGVFYVSPNAFADASLAFHNEVTAVKRKPLGFSILDSLSGFKGFVRIGKNRGFHFSLMSETENDFKMVGPGL